jgi:hypothetical protein
VISNDTSILDPEFTYSGNAAPCHSFGFGLVVSTVIALLVFAAA